MSINSVWILNSYGCIFACVLKTSTSITGLIENLGITNLPWEYTKPKEIGSTAFYIEVNFVFVYD